MWQPIKQRAPLTDWRVHTAKVLMPRGAAPLTGGRCCGPGWWFLGSLAPSAAAATSMLTKAPAPASERLDTCQRRVSDVPSRCQGWHKLYCKPTSARERKVPLSVPSVRSDWTQSAPSRP